MRLEAAELLSTVLRRGARRRTARAPARAARTDAATGLGAKMLTAVAAWGWTESAGPADRVVALSRAALDGGELAAHGQRPDGRRRAPARARRPPRRGGARSGTRSGRRAIEPARCSQFRRFSSGAGTTSTCAASSRRPKRSFAARTRRSTSGASRRRRSGRRPSSPSCSSTAARSRRRARSSTPRSTRRPAPTRRFSSTARKRRFCSPRAEREDALEYADGVRSSARTGGATRGYVQWRSLKAQALDRLGRQEEAVALAAEDLAIARGWGSPGTVGRSLRILGTLERAEGVEHLEEACVLLEQAGARLELAKALAALGGVLRRDRRPDGGARAAAPRARAGGDLRRQAARGRGPSRDLRNRRAAPHRGAPGSAVTDRKRAARRRPRGCRAVEPRHRPDALPDPEDGRGAPHEHVPQARDPLAAAARRDPRTLLTLHLRPYPRPSNLGVKDEPGRRAPSVCHTERTRRSTPPRWEWVHLADGRQRPLTTTGYAAIAPVSWPGRGAASHFAAPRLAGRSKGWCRRTRTGRTDRRRSRSATGSSGCMSAGCRR